MKKGIQKFKKHIGSTVLTMVVISLLLASAPATAINVGINNLLGSHKQGDSITFSITVDINKDKTGELLPIEYTNLTIAKSGGTSSVCKIYNNESVEGCGFLSVSSITPSQGLGYGYGYGYGYSGETKHNLGYGYGYGYENSNGTVTYNLVLNTSGMKGEYSATAIVYAGTIPFSSSTVSFNVWTASAAGNTTVAISSNSTTPATVDAITEVNTSIIINTNATASATGSVTVSKYAENPVNSTGGVSSLRAAGKYIDIVADKSIKDVLANATIRIYYTDAELAAAGISESSLAVYYYNPATDAWDNMGGVLGSGSNGKYISIVVNHFSLYGLFGSAPDATPAPATTSGSSGSSGSEIVPSSAPKVPSNTPESTPKPPENPPQPEQPKQPEQKPNEAAITPVTGGPTGMFLGVENTTWYGVIIGIAIIGLLVYAFRKGGIRIPGKSGLKYSYKK